MNKTIRNLFNYKIVKTMIIKRLILTLAASLFTIVITIAQFTLPILPYDYSALEPYIDSETMYIHYNNHHATYVRNLNEAVKDYPELQRKTVSELLSNLNEVPADIRTSVRNNDGGIITIRFSGRFWLRQILLICLIK